MAEKSSFMGVPWTGDDRAMLRLLESRLDEEIERRVKDAAENAPEMSADELKEAHKEWAKKTAREGDIEPLRAFLPEYSDFLHLPKFEKGHTQQRIEDQRARLGTGKEGRLWRAAQDVDNIRRLWRENFDGRVNRKETKGEKSAAWFAAQRWEIDGDITEDDVKREYVIYKKWTKKRR
jgi:hypothetical protein